MEKCPPGVICLSNSLVIGIFLICIISGIIIANKTNSFEKTKRIRDSSEDSFEENETISDIIKHKHHKHKHKQTLNPIIVVNSQPPPPPPDPHIHHVHYNMSSSNSSLAPPLRSMPNTTSPVVGVPINIQTRGPTPDMQQVGILTDVSNDKILALYGRPSYRGSSKWMYFSATDKFQSIKIPVWKNSRNCTDELGCDEIYEGDDVNVPAHGNTLFKATIYSLDAPRYIPFI
jgi:hypothetical protein